MHSILFVDDDAAMRDLVRGVLGGDDLLVHPVPTAEVALMMLKEQIRFDLLVTDVMLPGDMNGFELADIAAALRPELRILYLTGFVNLPRRRLAELHGKLVAKPLAPRRLGHEIRAILAA